MTVYCLSSVASWPTRDVYSAGPLISRAEPRKPTRNVSVVVVVAIFLFVIAPSSSPSHLVAKEPCTATRHGDASGHVDTAGARECVIAHMSVHSSSGPARAHDSAVQCNTTTRSYYCTVASSKGRNKADVLSIGVARDGNGCRLDDDAHAHGAPLPLPLPHGLLVHTLKIL